MYDAGAPKRHAGNRAGRFGHDQEMEPSDASLWARSRAGDADAFGLLFERHGLPWLYGIATNVVRHQRRWSGALPRRSVGCPKPVQTRTLPTTLPSSSTSNGKRFGAIILNVADSEVSVIGHKDQATLTDLASSILSQDGVTG
jgi:hypothetical protein